MWFNPIIKGLLKSPWHQVLSKGYMLVFFTGRKTGKKYCVPVNYIQSDKTLTVISFRKRTWWRNLRSSSIVDIQFKGKRVKARPEVLEVDELVIPVLRDYLMGEPRLMRYMNVDADDDGIPLLEDVQRIAPQRTMIQFELENV